MAFFMSILESKQKEYLETAANPTYAEAINAGIHASFTIGLVFAVIAFLLSLTVRKTIVPHK